MRAILKYLPNKFIALAAILAIALSPVQAAEKNKACEYRTFNIKTNNKATGLELLSELAEVCDFSIVVKDTEAEKALAKNLNGINIKNLSLDEVFQIVIQDNDLFYTYDKNYLKISALSTKSFKVDYISSIREGKAVINASVDATPTEASGTGTKNTTSQGQNTISSNESFDFWKTISTELTSVINTGSESYKASAPIINANAGMITVTATKKQLDRVGEYIDVLKERLHRQVLIDVSIVSVALSSSNKTGVDWSKFSLSLNSTTMFNNSSNKLNAYHADPYAAVGANAALTGNPNLLNNLTVVNDGIFNISGLIDFLGSSGETKVVSSPKVLTMNNQQALITIGDNVNYRVPETTNAASTTGTATLATTYTNYSIFIGVLLNITPEISEDNEIILRINPSVSNFKYTDDDVRQATGSAREIAPDTSEKKLSTVVKVKDGSTIILGGLITNNKGKQDSSVPLLSSIPLLGEAFKHSADTLSTNELVFVITPRIMGVKGTDKATLKDLGYSQKIYE
ncbi:pilus (MSHA type) biogenesis protein MshL [Sulfurospirillum oryzae]|uniref:pilus (MSHA type) biogenesis protein MshL n=1 Tax=Sulfurospirillum oryzae TaxID=2976535 RepID=UPI0021E82A45|nr:pilus (MSHA type) biogenesis protein MshL [Sulfurospirillum oryzae]